MNSYKVGLLFLTLAFFYDIFWVYLSPELFRSSVMATVATKVDLPIKIELPLFNPSPLRPCVLLGLGDMVLPGIYINFLKRFDRRN